MKSWRTTLFGCVCFLMAIYGADDLCRREAWAFNYWTGPIALAAAGLIGWHARDHKHKD